MATKLLNVVFHLGSNHLADLHLIRNTSSTTSDWCIRKANFSILDGPTSICQGLGTIRGWSSRLVSWQKKMGDNMTWPKISVASSSSYLWVDFSWRILGFFWVFNGVTTRIIFQYKWWLVAISYNNLLHPGLVLFRDINMIQNSFIRSCTGDISSDLFFVLHDTSRDPI